MATRESILETIRFHKKNLSMFGVKEIGLFGSFVRDRQTGGSDIDLLIDFEPGKETFDNLIATCEYLEGLFENHTVEVVTKNGLSKYIGPKILKEVEYVFHH